MWHTTFWPHVTHGKPDWLISSTFEHEWHSKWAFRTPRSHTGHSPRMLLEHAVHTGVLQPHRFATRFGESSMQTTQVDRGRLPDKRAELRLVLAFYTALVVGFSSLDFSATSVRSACLRSKRTIARASKSILLRLYHASGNMVSNELSGRCAVHTTPI